MLEIKLLKDCWGTYSYFGYKDNKQYTEAYDTIAELKEQYLEFNKVSEIILKGINKYNFEGSESDRAWIIKITQGIKLLTSDIIEQLINFKETIFFNDINSNYWFMDYKIDNVWVEGFKIDCCNMTMNIGLYN